MNANAIRRVVCAISGGVDSAVAALMLKERGYDVIGVHMVNWDNAEEGISDCPNSKDEIDAKKVCERLGIHFHRVEFVKEYWNEVFKNFLENYKKGRAVVPDVQCNKTVKFGLLHKFALERIGADAVATGHFARTNFGDFLENRNESKVARLVTAADPLKDQTYFLSTLTQAQLKRSMFPVGSLLKTEIRRRAKSAGMEEVADKPESMGICFIGKRRNFCSFIDQYVEPAEGLVRNVNSQLVVGTHKGVHHFSIGKRVRLSSETHQSPVGFFVSSLDPLTQTVWVCEGTNHPSLYATEFVVEEPEWIAESPFAEDSSVAIEFRCQTIHPPLLCKVSRIGQNRLLLKPRNPVRAVASGQTCAFYRGNECLGSGEVVNVVSTLADL